MKLHIMVAAVVASFCYPLAVQAQGIPDGVAHGAYVGNQAAGPIGAVVGGAVGGVIGGVEGALGIGPTYMGPTYVAYPDGEPAPMYRYHHHHHMRHTYRHTRHENPTG